MPKTSSYSKKFEAKPTFFAALSSTALMATITLLPATSAVGADNAWDTGAIIAEDVSGPTLVTDGSVITLGWSPDVVTSSDQGATWTAPVRVPASGQSANNFLLSRDGATTIASWVGGVPPTSAVHVAKSSDNGLTWSTPVPLPTLPTPNHRAQSARVVSNGLTMTAVWSAIGAVGASSSTDGGLTWSTPVQLASGQGTQPDMIMDGSMVTAVWRTFGVTPGQVLAATSTDGGATWNPTLQISSASSGSVDPAIARSGATTYVVWTGFVPGAVIQGASSADGLAWTAPVTISDAGEQTNRPRVVADGASATAVWSSIVGARSSMTSNSGATWSGQTTISSNGIASGANLATDGTTTTAVWVAAPDNRVQTSESTDGGLTWTVPLLIPAVGTTHSGPQIVTDGSTVTLAWTGTTVFSSTRIESSSFTTPGAVDPGVVDPTLALAATGTELATPLVVAALLLLLTGVFTAFLGRRTQSHAK